MPLPSAAASAVVPGSGASSSASPATTGGEASGGAERQPGKPARARSDQLASWIVTSTTSETWLFGPQV